ncbi:MAG: hypothetical protein R3B99_36915 [Polyangiales bacterium]
MASFSAMRLRALALLLAFSACGGDDDVFFDAGEVDARAPFDGGLDAPVAPLDAGDGDADVDAGIEPDLCAMEDRDADPRRVFFLGNSFTFTYDLPGLFRQLASAGGFTPPIVDSYTVGGQTLQGHRADSAANAGPARIPEGWDVVILQELSTRPTDAIGPAEQFKVDATYFHDLARDANPDGRVILYETFARRAGHALYPATFADPEDMQAQLRFHYDDAADEYIPRFTESVVPPNVEVARVGDAWEAQLALGEPPRLHGSDDYHPSRAGAYLSALVFVGTVYGRSTIGLPAIGVDDATALALQESADLVTGATRPVPSIACPAGIEVGDALRIDFGPTSVAGWPSHDALEGSSGPLLDSTGMPTTARVRTVGFTGTQTGGVAENTLGLPAEVSTDTLWVGSFDGHEAALALEGEVMLEGLPEGMYTLTLFASRTGDDGGRGRLTRYALGEREVDLEVADNAERTAVFDEVVPDASGRVRVRVLVSPDGAGRFGYVGSLSLERTR